MALTIRLLGRPRIERAGDATYHLRSRKSWALLAYLLLCDSAPTRTRLAGLLFADADDPLRALRWSLAEVRRCLGGDASVEGDPVRLVLPQDAVVDVTTLVHAPWEEAVEVVGLDSELLEGLAIRGAPAFESWLLSERRRIAAAAEGVLHEAAVGLMARGALDRARGFAVRAAALSPLDENHQALLIRLYRVAGDDAAAEAQYTAWTEVLDAELGLQPGAAVEAALRERPRERVAAPSETSIEAVIEAGTAAIAAGAVEPGIASLRNGVRLADAGRVPHLQVRSRLVLAEALIHSLRGLDEESLVHLHEADRLALDQGDPASSAHARAELGYVDFLRARYDRAELWLGEAIELGTRSADVQSAEVRARAMTYLGSVHSDLGNYPHAATLLDQALRLSLEADQPRRAAYALSMLGRLDLIRGDLDRAEEHLARSVALSEDDHWLSFLPWPQAMRGEVQLARHDPDRAAETLEQAFARACQLGDPCWEGLSARGLALVAEARAEPDRAIETLLDARARSNRLADPYVWLDAHILDALCQLGRRHAHPWTGRWVDSMRDLTSRTGMKELHVRALLHSAALGDSGDAEAAALLATDVDNPVLRALL